jgi:hypothetical protein
MLQGIEPAPAPAVLARAARVKEYPCPCLPRILQLEPHADRRITRWRPLVRGLLAIPHGGLAPAVSSLTHGSTSTGNPFRRDGPAEHARPNLISARNPGERP